VLLDESIAGSFRDADERALALVADRHGLGEPASSRGPHPPDESSS
jgi:hypothetical protein